MITNVVFKITKYCEINFIFVQYELIVVHLEDIVYDDQVHTNGIHWKSILSLMNSENIDVMGPYAETNNFSPEMGAPFLPFQSSKVLSSHCSSHHTAGLKDQLTVYQISTSSQFQGSDHFPFAFDRSREHVWSSKGS